MDSLVSQLSLINVDLTCHDKLSLEEKNLILEISRNFHDALEYLLIRIIREYCPSFDGKQVARGFLSMMRKYIVAHFFFSARTIPSASFSFGLVPHLENTKRLLINDINNLILLDMNNADFISVESHLKLLGILHCVLTEIRFSISCAR